MLAYIFWHWSFPGQSAGEYESALCEFHEALEVQEDRPPMGFLKSLTWRIEGAPWLPGGSGYEDWYLLEDSAALDVIEETAVGPLERVHREIASLAAGGTAGLYRPAHGVDAKARGDTVIWFTKPQGMSYAELNRQVAAIQQTWAAEQWLRKMTLGPTPECCLVGDGRADLPAEWRPVVVSRSRIWP